MIERYCTPGMSAIWSREAKYQRWLDVEMAICRGWEREGTLPKSDLVEIETKARFDLQRCDEIEAVTRHDLMAFVRNVSENVSGIDALSPLSEGQSNSPARWIHFGVTSYDVIDTALGMMMRDSCAVISESLVRLQSTLKSLFDRYGATPCIGRTHGIHAEVVTFGHKVQGWSHEVSRSQERLLTAKNEVSVGKISGAVGIHAHVSPSLESAICHELGLRADTNSTQIVSRDRHASLLCHLAVLAGTLERVATELRNLQRTEILEVQEEFASGQTGSSAMPHKRNPWNSETVCGLARIVRGNAHAMLESVMTWHERDLSNSSLERIVLPDTFQLVDFMVNRMVKILSGLVVLPQNMDRNIRMMGDLVYSEHVMVALIRSGMSREGAYKVAQRCAAKAWDGGDFRRAVEDDADVARLLSPDQVVEIFSLNHHLRHAPATID
ncbi:MAG: adenylosuccinate lyase [Chthonomonadaceae bacterium]|nr:adenylosuccinate lyase [Chthonomonadaceae bacterium]